MKKLCALIMMLAILLCACTQESPSTTVTEEQVSQTTEPSEATTQPVIPEVGPLGPMLTVSVPGISEEYKAEDGTVIFRTFHQDMSMIVPEPEVADRIIGNFQNRVDQASQLVDEIRHQALQAHAENNLQSAYLCNISHAPMRIDQTVLSLFGKHVTYSGGAHPNHICCAANYDMLTGDVLTLGSILTGADAKDTICQLVTAQLEKMAEEYYLWPSYPQTVAQRFSTEESYDENWYFSNTGLCFFFSPYEIAAYASGVIVAEIPYSQLLGLIDDAFFLPETEPAKGSVSIQPVSAVDLSEFTRSSELIMDPDAPAVVVTFEGTVQNIQIFAMNSLDLNTYTAYAAQSLSHSDAIVIEASQETIANMSLSYESGGQRYTVKFAE